MRRIIQLLNLLRAKKKKTGHTGLLPKSEKACDVGKAQKRASNCVPDWGRRGPPIFTNTPFKSSLVEKNLLNPTLQKNQMLNSIWTE